MPRSPDDARDADHGEALRSWLGASVAASLALLLIAVALAVDPAVRAALDIEGGRRLIVITAAFVAAFAAAASIWRSTRGDVPSALVVAWPAIPWLLSMPRAPAGDDLRAVAGSYADVLALAGLGSELASILLIGGAVGLGVSVSARAARTSAGASLGIPHVALAALPLWVVFAASVAQGLGSADAARLAMLVTCGTLAAALAVSAVVRDARASAGGLVTAIGVALAMRAGVDALRVWPAVDVLLGAAGAYETAEPGTFLALAFQLAACAPIAVVIAVALRGRAPGSSAASSAALSAGANAGADEAARAWTTPLAALSAVVIGTAAIAHGVGLRLADQRIREVADTVLGARESPVPGARTLVFDVDSAAADLNRQLASLELGDPAFVMIVARHPQLFSEHITRLLPLLSGFRLAEPNVTRPVELSAGPFAGRLIVSAGGSRIDPPDASAGALIEIENEGGGVVDLQRAVAAATARGLKPALRPYDPSAGLVELARREARDFAAQKRDALLACVRASPLKPEPPLRLYLHLVAGAVRATGFGERYEEDPIDADAACVRAAASAYGGFATPGDHKIDVELKQNTPRGRTGDGGPVRPPPRSTGPPLPQEPAQSEVLAVIKLGLPQVKACGRRHAVKGVIKASWIVEPSGRAKDARASGGNPLVVKCVEEAIKSWRFPASTKGKPVSIPFKLE